MAYFGFMRTAKCPICGKEFIVAPYNVYKLTVDDRIYNYCGYTCFRVAQREEERKLTEKKRCKGKC
jgi:hypothetical protein